MDRAAAATERRQVGRRKGTRKSKQLLTSEDLAEKAPRKALKRGREVEKIMVRLWVLGVSTVQRSGRSRFTQSLFVHLRDFRLGSRTVSELALRACVRCLLQIPINQ